MEAEMPKSKDGETRPADDAQEVLRRALRQANKYLSTPKIHDATCALVSGARTKLFRVRSLENFIEGNTTDIGQEDYDILARVWLHSPLGRTLRYLEEPIRPAYEQLIDRLGSGHLKLATITRDHFFDFKLPARFYVYHGSYLRADHYVVRVIEVIRDDLMLAVTDTVNDTLTTTSGPRSTHGVLSFIDRRPQFLLDGDENKQGLSLILGSDQVSRDNPLARVFGSLLVLTRNNTIARRHCLIVRETAESLEEMLEQSAILPKAKMNEESFSRHRERFLQLRRLSENVDHDPIFELPV